MFSRLERMSFNKRQRERGRETERDIERMRERMTEKERVTEEREEALETVEWIESVFSNVQVISCSSQTDTIALTAFKSDIIMYTLKVI